MELCWMGNFIRFNKMYVHMLIIQYIVWHYRWIREIDWLKRFSSVLLHYFEKNLKILISCKRKLIDCALNFEFFQVSLMLIYGGVISFPNKPKFDHSNIFRNLLLEIKTTINCLSAMLISLKVGPSPFKQFFFCFNESPLKMIKNAFYFILKALLVLKIFKLLSWLFGHINKLLE